MKTATKRPSPTSPEDDADETEDIFSEHYLDSTKRAQAGPISTLDNIDDSEGYSLFQSNVHLDDNHYMTVSALGKGAFSTVIKAVDLCTNANVAIKILRNSPEMRKVGLEEHHILSKISAADPDGKSFILKCHGKFEFGGHVCFVFDLMNLNLREVLKRYGKNVGLNLKAIQVYARQLFTSLDLLRSLRIIHGDIKPDNLLVNESKTSVRLADFGTSCEVDNVVESQPYFASRFYRAPEISTLTDPKTF